MRSELRSQHTICLPELLKFLIFSTVAAINNAAAAAKLAKLQRAAANSNAHTSMDADISATATANVNIEVALDFGEALCNQSVLRTVALHNRAPHAMPFELVCSHAAEFSAVPRAGVLECGQSVDIWYGVGLGGAGILGRENVRGGDEGRWVGEWERVSGRDGWWVCVVGGWVKTSRTLARSYQILDRISCVSLPKSNAYSFL
jgi:hypothetical protein